MADEKYTFETARIRLEEIAAEVRKKDTSLEKSLDLLEEGVRLANICTELVDHTDMSTPSAGGVGAQGATEPADESVAPATDAASDTAETEAVVAPVEQHAADTPASGADEVDEEYDDEDEPSDAASAE